MVLRVVKFDLLFNFRDQFPILGTSISNFFRLIDSVNKIEVAADWLALKYMWVQLGYALR